MSALGVRRDKAALSSGRKPHPATAPAGSNRSSQSCPDGPEVRLQLYPRKQPQLGHRGMSQTCQKATSLTRHMSPTTSSSELSSCEVAS